MRNFAIGLFAAILMVGTSYGTQAQNENRDGSGLADLKFLEFDADSDIVLDHKSWNSLLDYAVVVARESGSRSSTRQRPRTGTRIVRSGARVSRKRNVNYVPYRFLNKPALLKFRVALTGYLSGLRDVKVSSLDRDEQLAFWLNLHNATLVRVLLEDVPKGKLKRVLLSGDGLYNRVVTAVEGVDLTLSDIRYRILMEIWDDPIIAYGLFDGTISGPNILGEAFTSRNVYDLLKKNARDFINSPRGVRAVRGTIYVSEFYDIYSVKLGGPMSDGFLTHIREFADAKLADGMKGARKTRPLLYRWRLNEIIATSSLNASVSTGASESGIELPIWASFSSCTRDPFTGGVTCS